MWGYRDGEDTDTAKRHMRSCEGAGYDVVCFNCLCVGGFGCACGMKRCVGPMDGVSLSLSRSLARSVSLFLFLSLSLSLSFSVSLSLSLLEERGEESGVSVFCGGGEGLAGGCFGEEG